MERRTRNARAKDEEPVTAMLQNQKRAHVHPSVWRALLQHGQHPSSQSTALGHHRHCSRQRTVAGSARRICLPPPAATSAACDVSQVPEHLANLCGDLPIREVIMDVLHALDSHSGAVLQAPPGAGKTSTVPLALLAHNPPYLRPDSQPSTPGGSTSSGSTGKTILVLEPRRVAAKAAARRMAAILGEQVGQTVGYRVKLETRVSRATRIEVVTEGVLLRRLQSDPELSNVGAILFDEFHERNLDADLALALTADLQAIARPDLRLLVMSATLGGGLAERCSGLLAGSTPTPTATGAVASVPIVTSEGRSYPVRITHVGQPPRERLGLESSVVEVVMSALSQQSKGSVPPGDILCFLPGVAEINNTERLLFKALGTRPVDVVQLHGSLDPREQDRVVTYKGGRNRRIVLSTPIAESSLTLNGVTVVVDTGLRRSPAYDSSTGVNRLRTERISLSSADQRAGRAGRQGPGVAFRLWDDKEALQTATTPEIEQADLAPLALQLSVWGVGLSQPQQAATALPWLDPPPVRRLTDAAELLQELGALSEQGSATPDGRAMAGMGVHPRLAAMVQRGSRLGATELACVMASLLSEKDIVLRSGGGRGTATTASITLRLAVLAALAGGDPRDVSGAEALLAYLGRTLDTLLSSSVDVAGARRVLLGAYAVAQSVRSGPEPEAAVADTDPGDESGSGEDDLADTLVLGDGDGLEGAGMTTDDDDSSPSGDGGSSDGSESRLAGLEPGLRQRRRRDRGGMDEEAFQQKWLEQARREGLSGALVALSYPDRLAVRADRSNTRAAYALAGGGNVRLASDDDPLGKSAELLAVADLGGAREGTGANDTVRLAGALSRVAVDRYLKDFITQRNVVFWASGSKTVLARQQRRLGRLVLDEKSIPVTDEQALPAVLQGFKEMGGVRAMGLSKDTEAWRQRLLWLRRTDLSTSKPPVSSLPDLSDEALLASAASWLAPYLMGVRSKADMLKLDWTRILKGLVSRDDLARVEREVPSSVSLPTGTEAVIDYSRDPPIARCKIQEVYGLAETPRVAGGRIPVALELLSPSQQPLQITRDLASFWKTSWDAVRKEGKGRYPKHYWPDNPLEAEATKLTKKGMARQAEQQQHASGSATQASAGKAGQQGGGKSSGKGKRK